MMKIQKSYEQYIIAKMGYNRHWPKELRYGQHDMGSLQLPHFYMEQTALQIMTLERTLSSEETASLMQNVIETYQIQLGIENDPLQNPIRELYTDSAWLQQLTTAMERFNITIFRKNAMRLKKQR